jgi:hypothetical protein
MWVDVVCLRRDGVKLSPDELRSTAPRRARLTMNTVAMGSPIDGVPARRADVAQLWSEHGGLLGALEFARVSRVGGAGLLVVGVEVASGTSGHPQSWWCRMLLAAGDSLSAEAMPASGWHDTWPASSPAPLTDAVPPGDSTAAA